MQEENGNKDAMSFLDICFFTMHFHTCHRYASHEGLMTARDYRFISKPRWNVLEARPFHKTHSFVYPIEVLVKLKLKSKEEDYPFQSQKILAEENQEGEKIII